MKKLLTFLGILLFLTDLNAGPGGGRAIRSNWDGYMEIRNGEVCIMPNEYGIEIDLYFRLQSDVSLPNGFKVKYTVNDLSGEISFTDFDSLPNNEYIYRLPISTLYLGHDLTIDYNFQIISNGIILDGYSSNIFDGYGPWIIPMKFIEAGSKMRCSPIAIPSGPAFKQGAVTDNSTDITEKKSELFNVFPNPFLDNMQIDYFANENEDIEIKILDLNGKVVYMLKENNILAGNNQLNIDTKDIRQGIYFCHIRTKNQNQVVKLVKKE